MFKYLQKFLSRSETKPFSDTLIIRILVVLVVLLALFGGYYLSKFQILEKKYNRLLLDYDRLELTKLELIDIPTEVVE